LPDVTDAGLPDVTDAGAKCAGPELLGAGAYGRRAAEACVPSGFTPEVRMPVGELTVEVEY